MGVDALKRLARSVAAQSPEPAPAYAVYAGFGNNYGWLGGAVEVYMVRGRRWSARLWCTTTGPG